ncbi:SDR family oxidoreductase [Saccharothrix sp. S26]|uniref:SDR family oxidoreductase n=1 Tax=Saccharothrix sp. S26 TaxID=2907215 RepID=UPI001F2884E9|nr:SDR family oxidoreductase [Saccharothrix sp. S26]MCE6996341.1 SDR family oxidoreductase [Saccharothrix sp. S26]
MSRSVLVTGGNRGLGLAIARRFARNGDKVSVTHRDSPPPDDLFGVRCEVTDTASVQSAFDAVEAQHGPVEVLVANAGITRDALSIAMTDEEFDDVVATNLGGVFRVARRAGAGMLAARRGAMVFVSSAVGMLGAAGQVNYTSAKTGLVGMARSLARELGPRGITVNVVAPGLVETDMGSTITAKRREELITGTPLGRSGTPEEIADAVLFLAGNGFVTGAVLPVSGGLGMGH